MRRSLTLLATVMVLIGLMAAPAAADPPTLDGPYTDVFTDTDPCTGDLMEVTITITFYDHVGHNNNFVGRIGEKSGTTSNGYVLIGGHDNFRANNGGASGSYKDVWRNPDNGNAMQATGKFRLVGNSAFVDAFDLRCVGGPTV